MGARDLIASFSRLFVDVSYTRTQMGSTGVTRTVRNLLGEFEQSGVSCQPVAIHSSGFRAVSLPPLVSLAGTPFSKSGKVASLLRWVIGGGVRQVVLATLPLAWQQTIWIHFSRWTFDSLARQAPLVEFKAGDVLLLCDASWHYDAWDAANKARRQGARVVLVVYDLIPLHHPEFCAQLVSRVFQRWLAETVSASDAVLCISAAVEKDLRGYAEMTALFLPPMGHFRLGCDPIRKFEDGQVVRSEIADFLNAPAATFSAVGSFEPRKNYGWLLQAFEKMWVDGHNMRLLIVGRPTTDGQSLIKKMKQHREQGGKLLTVFDANDQELAYVYARSRALLFPSLAEGFGLPLVEARTHGCHVIASNLPAFFELADEGVSLFKQNSFAEITALVIAHAEKESHVAKTTMPSFTWNDSAHECLVVMDRLLAEPWKT